MSTSAPGEAQAEQSSVRSGALKLPIQLSSSPGSTLSPNKPKPSLERKSTPAMLKVDLQKGAVPTLGISRLSLSDAVAQRDQEFGGSASLPRMAPSESEEASSGFYSARGPREFKLTLGSNLAYSAKPQSARVPESATAKASNPKKLRRNTAADVEGSQQNANRSPRRSGAAGAVSNANKLPSPNTLHKSPRAHKPTDAGQRSNAPAALPILHAMPQPTTSPRHKSPTRQHHEGEEHVEPKSPVRRIPSPIPELLVSPRLQDELFEPVEPSPPTSPPSITRRREPSTEEEDIPPHKAPNSGRRDAGTDDSSSSSSDSSSDEDDDHHVRKVRVHDVDDDESDSDGASSSSSDSTSNSDHHSSGDEAGASSSSESDEDLNLLDHRLVEHPHGRPIALPRVKTGRRTVSLALSATGSAEALSSPELSPNPGHDGENSPDGHEGSQVDESGGLQAPRRSSHRQGTKTSPTKTSNPREGVIPLPQQGSRNSPRRQKLNFVTPADGDDLASAMVALDISTTKQRYPGGSTDSSGSDEADYDENLEATLESMGDELYANEYDDEEEADSGGEDAEDEMEYETTSGDSNTGGVAVEDTRNIDLERISVEELIREHNRNPDFLYMIEVGDASFLQWLSAPERMKKLLFALTDQFGLLSLADPLTAGRTYEKDILASFSYYLFTSIPNNVLAQTLLESPELLDLFFFLVTLPEFKASPDWTRTMLFLLTKCPSSHLLIEYMTMAFPGTLSAAPQFNTQFVASLDLLNSLLPPHVNSTIPNNLSSTDTGEHSQIKEAQEGVESAASLNPPSHVASDHRPTDPVVSYLFTRGQYAMSCLLRNMALDNAARVVFSLLLPDESNVPWIDFLSSCDFISLIAARFDRLLSLPTAEFGRVANEATNLTELCGLIATKASNSHLAHQLQSTEFTSRLVKVVCTKDPHPIASNALALMCHLFDVSYNNGEYENRDVAPIIASLLKHSDQEADFTPLQYLAWQLDHPTLQSTPPSSTMQAPLGMYRLQLLRSVNSLLKTNYGLLHKEMFTSGLVSSVMDVLFRHATGSVIHLNVADTLGNVMYFERTEWLLAWLEQYHFVEKVASGFEKALSHLLPPTSPTRPPRSPIANASTSPSSLTSTSTALQEQAQKAEEKATPSSASSDAPSSANTSAPGRHHSPPPRLLPCTGYCTQPEYAPHLVSICIKLDLLASSNAPLKEYLHSQPRWDYLYTSFVEPLSKQYRELSDVSTLRRNALVIPF